jgi:hypothetical protein
MLQLGMYLKTEPQLRFSSYYELTVAVGGGGRAVSVTHRKKKKNQHGICNFMTFCGFGHEHLVKTKWYVIFCDKSTNKAFYSF